MLPFLGSMSVDGSDSNAYIYLPAQGGLDTKFSMTLSVWVKLDASTFDHDDTTSHLFAYYCLDTNDTSTTNMTNDDGECGGSEFNLKVSDGNLFPHIILRAEVESSLEFSDISIHDLTSTSEAHILTGVWTYLTHVINFHDKKLSAYKDGELIYYAQ